MAQSSMFKNVQQQREIPLSEKVAQQIGNLIKERNIQIGDKLPNEFELAESLNVGRGTIREAVKILVARNCLEIRRGKGTFVTEELGNVEDKVKLAEELYEIRMQLEPWIASLAAARIHEEEKAELMARCDAVDRAILAGEDHNEADNAFHLYIAQCTRNSILPEIIPIITYCVRLFTRFREPDMLEKTMKTHRAVATAICEGTPEAAGEAMRRHLLANLDSIEALRKNANQLS